MKFSKLLKFVLGLSGFFTFHADGADGGGSMDMGAASDAFETMFGGDAPAEETQEAAAERLAAEEAAGDAPKEPPEDGEQEQDGEQVAEPETVTIEVDGKPVQMTKAELAEAVKGQMRQKDYTQKTMETAEEKRQAQTAKQAADAQREQLANQLHTYTVQTQGALQNIAAQMTDELLQSDPVQYLMLDRTLKQGQADFAKANSELTQLQQQYQAEQVEKQKEYQQSQHQALLGKLPDWKDPVKAKDEALKIQAYLNTQDFSGQELGEMNDHRLVILARKAMMYDGLMERAAKATKQVAAAPAKVERTGTPTQRNGAAEMRAAALNKLSKGGGKLSDAAAAFASFM